MKNKWFYVLVGILSVIMLSACNVIGSAWKQPQQRTIAVSGNGKVYVTPDIAYINIGVHTEAKSVKEAIDENTAQAQKVSEVLKTTGVDSKDIITTNFNVYPSQQYGPDGQPLEMKYVVDNTVSVTLRDLGKIGVVLSDVVGSGANNIYGITFDIENRDKANSEARKAAVDNARTQAGELASAAGLNLGDVVSISVGSLSSVYPLYEKYGYGGAMAQAATEVPISSGQIVISADITIVYEIK